MIIFLVIIWLWNPLKSKRTIREKWILFPLGVVVVVVVMVFLVGNFECVLTPQLWKWIGVLLNRSIHLCVFICTDTIRRKTYKDHKQRSPLPRSLSSTVVPKTWSRSRSGMVSAWCVYPVWINRQQ